DLAGVMQAVDAQGDFAAAIAARAHDLRGELRVRPGRVGIHRGWAGGGPWLLCAADGTPNRPLPACSTGVSGWCAATTMIHTQPASEATNSVTPSHTTGWRYHAVLAGARTGSALGMALP